MKDGAIVCNSGHFDVEVDVKSLQALALARRRGRAERSSRTYHAPRAAGAIHLLAEGRLVNLAAAEGHPAAVMDMSFSVQALTAAFVGEEARDARTVGPRVPEEVDREVAR